MDPSLSLDITMTCTAEGSPTAALTSPSAWSWAGETRSCGHHHGRSYILRDPMSS
jgi:hypothetical protein